MHSLNILFAPVQIHVPWVSRWLHNFDLNRYSPASATQCTASGVSKHRQVRVRVRTEATNTVIFEHEGLLIGKNVVVDNRVVDFTVSWVDPWRVLRWKLWQEDWVR